MSTGYTQLINSFLTYGPLLFSVCALVYGLYLHVLFSREFPAQSTINRLRAEVEELSGYQADLSDRFSRFQKRQDMRAARAEKTQQDDLVAQAKAMIGAGAGAPPAQDSATSNKAALYAKLRNH